MAALAVLRGVLERYAARSQDTPEVKDQESLQHEALQEAAVAMPTPLALDRLCQIFNLSTFECHVLLLYAGMELDESFAKALTDVQGDPQRAYPTFGLALAALPNLYWDAIAPAAPLRYWRLIKIGSDSGITLSPLQIDEQILHYLVGVEHLDERLVGFVEPLQVAGDLVSSHCALVGRIVAVWSQAKSSDFPIVQLCGSDAASKRQIAAAACRRLGYNLCVMPTHLIPTVPSELDTCIRLWNREALLHTRALLVDCDEFDRGDAVRVAALTRLIEHVNGVFISSYERIRMPQRLAISLDVHKPTSEEQRTVWQETLAAATPLNGEVKLLTAQFNLSPATIRAACAETAGHLTQGQGSDLGSILWDACRVQTRPRLDELAQRITPGVDWESLVLPEAQQQILREIAAHVRQRAVVYEAWGFGAKGTRGLGISALFAVSSGTGKTLAAEVLTRELRLDLYRIDLSSVVSKYIGETEKNLRQVFDAAEAGGVILLFDEADALFGKRSEVKDSRDRYANIEVSYLLQRMECYPGLAVLTTNLKNAIDTAFLRRIRFVVQFPFPDAAQQAEIWRQIFPSNTPTEGLDPARLAQLNVAGGNIRNIALNAAFLAADAGEPVRMTHLLRAACSEYAKLEKTLTGAEINGWT